MPAQIKPGIKFLRMASWDAAIICPFHIYILAGNSSLGCDFENANLCGYTQDKTDVFDWTRGSGQTSSGSTGPTNDHTYSTITGTEHFVCECSKLISVRL